MTTFGSMQKQKWKEDCIDEAYNLNSLKYISKKKKKTSMVIFQSFTYICF